MNYTLTFYLYRAKEDIDWTNPGTVIRTLVRNKLRNDRFFMSHIDVRLAEPEGELFLAGMRRVSSWGFYLDLLMGKYGMELITEIFPGDFMTRERIHDNISYAKNNNIFKALHFTINEPTAVRLKKYFDEYCERNYQKQYSGFLSNPFKGEGAGCVAFALSFLKVAGLLSEELVEQWSRNVTVPRKLFANSKSKDFISIWGYLMGKNSSWADQNDDACHLRVFDPLLIYLWVEKQAGDNQDEIILDYSNYQPPTDDYWQYSWY